LAREVVRAGSPGLAEVVAAFGEQILRPDGELDRPALGRIVFNDSEKRRQLEHIVHPRVRARAAEIVRAAPPDAIVVNDVPLLVEAGLSATYDLVLVVLAPVDVRVARLERDRGMAPDEARSRIAAQASDDERRAVADVVVENDGSPEQLRDAVDRAWRDRIVPAAERAARNDR
jgi:dephospho-CoA kinase